MTDKKTEALKLALEALKRMKGYGNTFAYRSHEQNPHEQVCEAITALEALASEAIEQPAQQWQSTADKCELQKVPANGSLLTRMMNERVKSNVKQVIELYDSPDQPAQQQEPVAWITKNGKGWLRWHKPEDSEKNKDSIPLYTAPTSKPWVGLTQTDLVDCDEEELKQARYWENKLKEKNT